MTRVIERLSPPSTLLSYDAFLRQFSGGEHVEWVDGRAIEMAAVTVDHDGLNGFLYSLLKSYVEWAKLGRVLHDPFQMKTGPNLPGRAPDIQFVSTARLRKLKKLYFDGPADLVIEVVSSTSRTTDRLHKFGEYEAGGVPEYWILDPELQRFEFFRRDKAGRYKQMSLAVNGILYSKAVKGFWIRLDWLESPPILLTAMKELGMI